MHSVKAYSQNPEHYYLANFIQHLEFIQSQEYKKIETCFRNIYLANMVIIEFYNRGMDRLLLGRHRTAYIFKLLPLSEEQFIDPIIYNGQIQIIKEKR